MVTISTTRADTHLTSALHGTPVAQASPELLRHTAMMGYHDAFLVGALLMLIPLGLSFLIHDDRVAKELQVHAKAPAGELVGAEA